jgi:hypothetical protein
MKNFHLINNILHLLETIFQFQFKMIEFDCLYRIFMIDWNLGENFLMKIVREFAVEDYIADSRIFRGLYFHFRSGFNVSDHGKIHLFHFLEILHRS